VPARVPVPLSIAAVTVPEKLPGDTLTTMPGAIAVTARAVVGPLAIESVGGVPGSLGPSPLHALASASARTRERRSVFTLNQPSESWQRHAALPLVFAFLVAI
jgi:hypothetical protein